MAMEEAPRGQARFSVFAMDRRVKPISSRRRRSCQEVAGRDESGCGRCRAGQAKRLGEFR